MQITFQTLLIICPLIFLGGFVDSIAGGGGLISLPSYILIGLPVHMAYGTNKFTSFIGTSFSVFRFIKGKRVHYKAVLASVCGALVGSFLGANLTLALEEIYLKYCLIVLLPITAIFILTRRNFGEVDGEKNLSDRKIVVLSMISGLFIGAYDGFFGPGAGALLILVHTSVLGFNLTVASGNAKVVNLSSNIAALITFIIGGKVAFLVGIPAAFFGILGNWVGSGLALKNGAKIIKPIFIGVLALLFIKISIDVYTSFL